MNRTDVLTGRIVQRVLDARDENRESSRVVIKHGVDYKHSVYRLMDNLFEFFPDALISFKECNFGYELRIEVDF